jgi:hypothetical protein
MEELIKDLKNRYDGANDSMKHLEHKSYKKGRQEGKAAAYEHCIRHLEKLKTHVVLADVRLSFTMQDLMLYYKDSRHNFNTPLNEVIKDMTNEA